MIDYSKIIILNIYTVNKINSDKPFFFKVNKLFFLKLARSYELYFS